MDRLEPVEADGVAPSDVDTVVGPVRGLQTAVVDDSLVVLDVASGRRVLLNATGALIFTAVDAERTVGDLVAQLAAETGAEPDMITDDVLTTVDRLLSQGMVTRDHPVTPAAPTVTTPEPEPVTVEDDVDPTAGVTWAFDSGVRIVAGTPVVFRAEVPELADELREVLQGFPTVAGPDVGTDVAHRVEIIAAPPADGQVEIVVDGRARTGPVSREVCSARMLNQLDVVLTDHGDGLRFHAGAVERAGEVVIVLGQSGHGKSTLTAALVQSGWSYMTDELVVVDPETLRVHGYARPFDLDEASRVALGSATPDLITGARKDKVFASRFGPTSSGGRAALIVLLTGAPPTTDRSVTTIPAPEALMALLPLTFEACFDDPGALEDLAALCSATPSVRLSRGPLAAMVATVESEFAAVDRSNRR